jgi:hypothetical protein
MSAVAINQSLLYCMRLLRSMRRRLVGKSLTCPVPEEKTLSFPFLSSQTSRQKFSPLHPMPSHAHPMPSHAIASLPTTSYPSLPSLRLQHNYNYNSIQFNSIHTITIFYPAQICCKVPVSPILLNRVLWCSLAVLIYPVHHRSDKLSGSPSVRFVSCPATSPYLI